MADRRNRGQIAVFDKRVTEKATVIRPFEAQADDG